jgi:RNA polymerase sigma-70 factor (family 1)
MALQHETIPGLFKRIAAGDKQAFNTLFGRYYTRLTAFARQYTQQAEAAEEVVSDVFVKLWLRRASLVAVARPEVYLYVAVKNTALNYLRSRKNQPALDDIPDALPATAPEDKELQQVLQSAIRRLPEQRRLIFRLIKEDGLKSGDVATILGLSSRTVENQLYKAVKTLADQLSLYLGYRPGQPVKRLILLLISMLLMGGVLWL